MKRAYLKRRMKWERELYDKEKRKRMVHDTEMILKWIERIKHNILITETVFTGNIELST